MKTYTINIAKAYTMSDWRGLPAHKYFARLTLEDSIGEDEAMRELIALSKHVYPWPRFHLTLRSEETVRNIETKGSTAPAEFLEKHQWAGPSVHGEG